MRIPDEIIGTLVCPLNMFVGFELKMLAVGTGSGNDLVLQTDPIYTEVYDVIWNR